MNLILVLFVRFGFLYWHFEKLGIMEEYKSHHFKHLLSDCYTYCLNESNIDEGIELIFFPVDETEHFYHSACANSAGLN